MRKRLTTAMVLLVGTAWPLLAHQGHAEHAEPMFDAGLLGFSGLKEVFNLHPAFVHFPIALIPTALLLYFLGIVLKKPALNLAGRLCLYLALISGVITIATGLAAQASFPHNETIHHMMQTHRTIGLVLACFLMVLTVWSFWQKEQAPRGSWAFLIVLAGATYLVLQNGDLGSRMVYIQGAAVKPAVQAITSADADEEGHHHHHDDDHDGD